MELISSKLNLRFMHLRKPTMFLSLGLILLALAGLAGRGLNLGIDFTGGVLVEVGYAQPVELERVRADLAQGGFGDALIQHFGSAHEVLIRLAPSAEESSAKLSDSLFRSLSASGAQVELRRVEFVGPQVGEELTEDGGLAVLYALAAILVYVALRFEYRFAVGSVLALMHDVIITLGVFALLQIEFDLSVLAALLAVIGYSLNDTIVVFDRIRENFRKMRKGTPAEIIDRSLSQTLSRTLMTSLTTLLVLIALYSLGGEVISGFSLALIIGVLVGTYSSIYVASTSALLMGVSKEDLMPVQKEGAELDQTP
ncbi:protein translocase subunit SecF [Magnetovirga frankeli]|uniref:protein translocase subunit SecF n=1 Tax=Magnetovirga frankeli TaxID=947516 RepID=UPI0012931821|nr:protein translocase subunit SecF [gamma proteobacterium SS-5]